MKNLVLLEGALVEPLTNYNADYSFDEGATREQVEYQLANGMKGFFVNSLSGDMDYLPCGMDVEYAALMVKVLNGRAPVLAQVYDSNTEVAIKKVQQYKNVGVDIVLVAQPRGVELPDESRRHHLEAIFESEDDITMGIHNCPGIGYYLRPEIIADMANKYEHVVYIKNATLDMAHIQSLHILVKDENFRYFEGSDSTILATMAGGGHGVVSGLGIVFPKLVYDLCEACLAGDFKTARILNDRVSTLRYLNKQVKTGSAYRFMADETGVFPGGRYLPPKEDMSDEEKAYLRREYAKLDWLDVKLK